VTVQDFPTAATELVLDPPAMRDGTFAQPHCHRSGRNAASVITPVPVMVPAAWHTYPERQLPDCGSTAVDLARFLPGYPGRLLGRQPTPCATISLPSRCRRPRTPAVTTGLGT
jgi:hypothetical protein